MPRAHLFGPVSPTFAAQNLRRHVEEGVCVVFDHSGPISVGPKDTWDSFAARFPGNWRPQFLALPLQYSTIPCALWQAPVPIVGMAGDWHLLWHRYRHLLPLCDLVLTDQPGVEALSRLGIRHVQPAQLFACQRAFVEFNYGSGPGGLDVLFL